MPGKLPALTERFADFTVPKWSGVGFRLVGFWTPDIGVPSTELTYMLAWESLEERKEKFDTWHAAPGRAERWAASEKDGPLVKRVHNMLLEPTAFCQVDRKVPVGDPIEGRAPYIFRASSVRGHARKTTTTWCAGWRFHVRSIRAFRIPTGGLLDAVIGGHSHMLIYMLAWESHDERAKKFAAFRADPERERVFNESEKDGQIVERVNTAFLRPAPFSPLR